MTVNKAILEFVDREYLSSIQGSGTFVSKMRKEGSRSKEMSFNDSLTQKGFKVKTIVLEQKIVTPNREVAEALDIPLNEKVMYFKRLRKVHEEPVVIQEAYLKNNVVEALMNIDFTEQSLYASLKQYCGIDIQKAKGTVEAKAAHGEACEYLELAEQVTFVLPAFLVCRISFVDFLCCASSWGIRDHSMPNSGAYFIVP